MRRMTFAQPPGDATPVDFYFDFSSPYAYLASEWIEALAAQHDRAVRWHAVLLGATFKAAELRAPVAHPMKREYSLRDIERSARFDAVAFAMPTPFPVATQHAARVFGWLHARDAGAAVGWSHHGLRAYFARGVDLSDAAQLRCEVAACGIDPGEAEAAWTDPHWKAQLKDANDAAIAAGVFGAPFFIIDGEPFWGNDRRVQIERWLAGGGF
jgi:2-hydroxychromene-2-carboxylate isomerase